ncbi:MAG: phasin family protein [Parvularculaceae bacterium]
MAAKKQTVENAFESATAFTSDAFKEGYEKFATGSNSFADFQKGSLEAWMQSANIVAKGFEKAATEQASFAKDRFEDSVAVVKAASTSKSVQEAIELQSDFARTAFEKNLAFANTLADHWNGVAKEASEPMTKRYSEFVEMVQSYRA